VEDGGCAVFALKHPAVLFFSPVLLTVAAVHWSVPRPLRKRPDVFVRLEGGMDINVSPGAGSSVRFFMVSRFKSIIYLYWHHLCNAGLSV
jgi:hypothetical protein